MDEKDLQIILTLTEYQNLSRTAERLYLTQPALTSRIKRLEEDLGVQLLRRTSKGVSFTPAGETVSQCAKDLTMRMRQMRERVKSEQGSVSGLLHLGCSTQYARYRAPALLSQFLREYPNISVDVVADRSINIQRELNRNSFSAAIIRGNFKWQGRKKLLSTESYCLVYKHKVSRNELQNITYIHQKTDNLGQECADEWVRLNFPYEPLPRIESNNIEVCISMVELGMGWAILPEICLQGFAGYQEPIFTPDGQPIVRNTYLCYKESELTLPHVRKFIEYMEAFCQTT